MRKLPYKEGDWISVPLRDEGYALGVIARTGKGGGMIGYFFGPRYENTRTMRDAENLDPSDAILICHCGDLGLFNGEWKVIGRFQSWDRSKWEIPAFLRRDSITRKPSRIYYAGDDLNLEILEIPCSEEEAIGLPEDGAWGYGAVEIRLTKLLHYGEISKSRSK